MKRVLLLLALVSTALGASAANSRDPSVRVGILLFDGVQIIDFAAPYEVFGQAGFKVSTVSEDGKPITTSMGLKVTPDASIAEGNDFDILLIPGGHVSDVEKDKEVQTWLKSSIANADIALSVCTGSHILAAAGLLENLTATTFHNSFGQLARLSPSTKVVRDARWVDNGKIVTSAGLSSGIDAALHVVERLLGEERARTVAMTLEYDWNSEEGFVRGQMADRFFTDIAIDWPQNTRAERMVSYGDRKEWVQRSRVWGSEPPSEYLKRIKETFGALPNWNVKQASSSQLLLDGTPEEGSHVTMRVDTSEPVADGGFDLAVSVEVEE